MFICDVTGKVSKPREPMIRVVDKVRRKEYHYLVDGEPKTSVGEEIVKELKVTQEGLDLYNFTLLTKGS